jgi:thiol-disulfide isomerase/thioredoxin
MSQAWCNLMGCKQLNLMGQLCLFKEYLNGFNSWRHDEAFLKSMVSVYLENFTNPYIRQKAEAYYAQKTAQKELSTPLPAGNKAADLIRSISEKYPGRYLMIDFWGMGCGPCRSAIQSSKNLRKEIAKRDDIKLIFIAGERVPGGSDAYKNYVPEWLADEETICIPDADFTRLQELFRFNGIPHYEVITPDCRRVRDDLQIHGFYNFDQEMKLLKERLK